MKNSKELFIKAFLEAERIDNSKLKSEDEIEWDFSEKFEKSMNKLIKKNNHIKLSTRRNIRKGLLVAIVAIIVTFTGLMSVSAARTPFVEFIKSLDKRNSMTEIHLDPDSTPPVDTIETEYTLSYVPDGYKLKTYQKDELRVFIIWENDKNEEIVFSQSILDSNYSVDNENNYQEIIVNGYEAYLNEYELSSTLLWRDDCYWFNLIIPNSLDKNVIEMSKTICEKN